MELETIKQKIELEEDFIFHPRSANSLSKLLDKHPQGLSNEEIAKVMLMSEDEVEDTYQSAIKKLQKILNP